MNVVARGWDRQEGIVDRPDQVVLFVTLDKRGRPEAQRYEGRFLSPTEFHPTLPLRRHPGVPAWEGKRPITVWWRMEGAVPEGVWGELRLGG